MPMSKSDIFAVLIALLFLGAGAYLSTLEAHIIRSLGGGLVASALVCILLWFIWERAGLRFLPTFIVASGVFLVAAGTILHFANIDVIKVDSGAETPSSPVDANRKVYSAGDTDRLTDLCNDLASILVANGANGGGGVYSLTANLQNDFRQHSQTGLDVIKLQSDLTASRRALKTLSDALYGDQGILRRFQLYPDEQAIIIKDSGYERIVSLEGKMDNFASGLDTIKAAKARDPALVPKIARQMETDVADFTKATQDFQKWEFEVYQNSLAFKRSLQK